MSHITLVSNQLKFNGDNIEILQRLNKVLEILGKTLTINGLGNFNLYSQYDIEDTEDFTSTSALYGYLIKELKLKSDKATSMDCNLYLDLINSMVHDMYRFGMSANGRYIDSNEPVEIEFYSWGIYKTKDMQEPILDLIQVTESEIFIQGTDFVLKIGGKYQNKKGSTYTLHGVVVSNNKLYTYFSSNDNYWIMEVEDFIKPLPYANQNFEFIG